MSIQLERPLENPLLDFERTYTVDEFLDLDWPDDDETEYELIGGRIVPKERPGGPSAKHSRIVNLVGYYLEGYAGVGAGANQLGKVYSDGPTNLGRPKGSNYLKPDVCFVAEGRTQSNFPGPIPVAPDLAVEVISPTDVWSEIIDKVTQYLQAGTPLIWVVDFFTKSVFVFHLDQPMALLNIEAELSGEGVLPGFKLAVKALFE